MEDFLRLSKPFFDTQLAEIVPKFGHFWWLYYVLALEWWHLRWTSRGLYVFLSPSCSLSKTTKLILLDSLLQEVCINSVFDWLLALSSLGLSVFFGQSQTTFFWRANESRLINIRTWEIEWLLSERHGLCVCCHCISAAGHPGSVMCQDSLSIGCLKRPSYYCLNTTTRGKFPRDLLFPYHFYQGLKKVRFILILQWKQAVANMHDC